MRLVAVSVVSLAGLLTAACGGDSDDGNGAEAMSFEGRPWLLASGVDLPQDATAVSPNATFEHGIVGGSTGCHRFTASYTVDAESLEIATIATTRTACPPPVDAIERSYLPRSTSSPAGAWTATC